MKIAFLMPFLEVYGAVRSMVDLSNEMVDRGHNVSIYHSDGSPCRWLKTKASIYPLAVFLRLEHEIVIANLRGVAGLLGVCHANLKLYWVADRWSEHSRNYQSMLKSNWVKLAVTKWSQKWLLGRGVSSYYVFPGINREVFHPIDGVKSMDGVLRLLCSGDDRPGKGLELVPKIVGILRDKYSLDVELLSYYGKGLLQNKMAEFYGKADIFMDFPWGDAALRCNPVVESMACGTPVVCLDHESVSDWAVHKKTAILVPERNPDLMAAAVFRLFKDEGLMEEIRSSGLKKVSKFTWKGAAEKLEEVVEGCGASNNF